MVKLGKKRGVNARLDTYKKQQQKKIADEEILEESDASHGYSSDNEAEDKPSNEVEMKDAQEEESSETDDEEARELQIALRDGLLKSDGLNYIVPKKRPILNKAPELRAKVIRFANNLPWIETVDVTSDVQIDKKLIENDLERELHFYRQAESAVQAAYPKLLKLGVKVLRPSDYYAEMAKSDHHMQKIRKRLLDLQTVKDRQEAYRRMREEKKFAAKVQKEANEKKQAEKKKFTEAVQKHKKGMQAQLENMLNNVKRQGLDRLEDLPEIGRGKKFSESRKKNFKREYRDKKFGYGGKHGGKKRNDKESFENVFNKRGAAPGFSSAKGKKFGKGKGRR
ncbi:hypothetical protein WR25_18369 [Diploscapter pachys]|uniref:Uncharacterized protein n=1 Tax=Diploscapter pachys TaxID=2018661 RepID=A0A2A2JZ12_9BILA|nr:hypothetical protein WR25_18369 [Diploscapter pachys]